MVLLRTASDKMCHINNRRRAAYGYDQRIEVLGAKGMLRAENIGETTVEHFGAQGHGERPAARLLPRALRRCLSRRDWPPFSLLCKDSTPMPVGARDGRQALVLAEAALKSHKTGKADEDRNG